jgi:predicted HTH domain antitoxin
MKTVQINIPDLVDFDDKEVVRIVATKFFEKGKLSLGQAAEMTGLSKRAFMEILADYGVSIFNYPPSELASDIENAKNHNS